MGVVGRGGPASAASAAAGGGGGRRANKRLNDFERKILDELLDKSPGVQWGSIAGLAVAKQTLMETIILPALRPDIFSGLRSPPKGVLLYGPPGTGKTMLAKAVATESKAAFFNISASALTSKWVGEGEKMVRGLFSVARAAQPSVIFVDEIDSLLTARSSNEHEGSRRLKTEFLVQMDGADSATDEERVLVIGATNRPQELDDAIIRRLSKRIYVPLPNDEARHVLLAHLMGVDSGGGGGTNNGSRSNSNGATRTRLGAADMRWLVRQTDGYSASDITGLCKEAALGPIRDIGRSIVTAQAADVRPVVVRDFEAALRVVRPSVSKEALRACEKWSKEFGTGGA